jgi:hypothetical protein
VSLTARARALVVATVLFVALILAGAANSDSTGSQVAAAQVAVRATHSADLRVGRSLAIAPPWTAQPPTFHRPLLSPVSDSSRLIVRFVVAAKAGTVAKNGETAATRAGRAWHQAWDYGPGFEKEFVLPSGKRVDGINFTTREIRELKPNNPRAMRRGQNQVDKYLDELHREFPGQPWTGQVVTYP